MKGKSDLMQSWMADKSEKGVRFVRWSFVGRDNPIIKMTIKSINDRLSQLKSINDRLSQLKPWVSKLFKA